MSGWCSTSKILNSFQSDDFACAWKCHANKNCNAAYHFEKVRESDGWCLHSNTPQSKCKGDLIEIGKYDQIYSKQNETVLEPDTIATMRGNDRHLK